MVPHLHHELRPAGRRMKGESTCENPRMSLRESTRTESTEPVSLAQSPSAAPPVSRKSGLVCGSAECSSGPLHFGHVPAIGLAGCRPSEIGTWSNRREVDGRNIESKGVEYEHHFQIVPRDPGRGEHAGVH